MSPPDFLNVAAVYDRRVRNGGHRPPLQLQLALLLAVVLLAVPFVRAEVKAGQTFPSLAAAGLRGALPATAGKVVLVDFWASWCAPCKTSFPVYAKIHADYAARGLVIVAVSSDEKIPDYDRFVKKLAPPFATLLDQDHKFVRQVQIPTTPTSYLIDRDGRVRFVHPGWHDDTERDLRKEIETLLAEKNPTP